MEKRSAAAVTFFFFRCIEMTGGALPKLQIRIKRWFAAAVRAVFRYKIIQQFRVIEDV